MWIYLNGSWSRSAQSIRADFAARENMRTQDPTPGPTLYVFSLLQYWTTEKVEKLENKYVKFFYEG